MRPSLLALCGGIAVADGELCWPLPGHTYISCHFGEMDAFGNAGHRGTDIPAPEGTPILAAHSGTVLVSGWNDSYGNQVLLDNGAGLSTRYAHMTQTAVTAGEAVTAGQVIGYVGSTGDSTGFHLHFEVMQNGVGTTLELSDALRRISSGSKSLAVVPSSTRPIRSVAPLMYSSASVSVVLPQPAWPATRMLRMSLLA